ncbi:MAG: hypothetical protein LC123_06895 [Burkholderiales bacterium]|nr:hypothetical protein [Anaerolineae bacterium]MCZ2419548.1 hypothetical protein [Burkholderiales bacterium]
MPDKIRLSFRIYSAEHPELYRVLSALSVKDRSKQARGLMIRAFYESGREPAAAAGTPMNAAPLHVSSTPTKKSHAPGQLDALGDVGGFKFGLGNKS